MELGVQLPHLGPLVSGEGTVRLAERAEALGFDSVWVGDHIVYPAPLAERFGPACYEALTTLAWVGARTSRIRLGTGVLVLPCREPVLLAKQLATLDALSGGRLEVGVGVGWLEEEFRALGVPFERRGALTDAHLEVMQALWAGERVTWEGHGRAFRDLLFAPRPLRAGGPPLWVGGNTAPAMRRAARHGAGWLPIWHAPTGRGYSPRALAGAVEALAGLAAEAGRSSPPAVGGLLPLALTDHPPGGEPTPLIGPPESVIEALVRLGEAGLRHAILSPFYGVPETLLPRDLEGVETLLERICSEVRPHLGGG